MKRFHSAPWLMERLRSAPWLVERFRSAPWLVERLRSAPWLMERVRSAPFLVKRVRSAPWAVLAMVAVILLCGCRITKSKDAHDDVSIETPMGGLSVKRDPTAVLGKVGLPAYPGAQPVAEGSGNHDSANVDLSFGDYKLQVMVVKLRTSDDTAKVEAFYRMALAQYSDVIACHDNQPVGSPARTGMGLTCAQDKHVKTIETDEKAGDLQLKAGTPSRQHIVALSRHGGETHMDLVSLELPKGMVD